MVLFSTGSLARDPPDVSVEEALKYGGTAFTGRVVGLWETERVPQLLLRAKARIAVGRCFYGGLCSNKIVTLEHLVIIGEEGLPLELVLGAQYLFVLRKKTGRAREASFDSEDTSGPFTSDAAWRIGGFEDDFSERSAVRLFRLTWPLNPGEQLAMRDLVGWVAKRGAGGDAGVLHGAGDGGTRKRGDHQ